MSHTLTALGVESVRQPVEGGGPDASSAIDTLYIISRWGSVEGWRLKWDNRGVGWRWLRHGKIAWAGTEIFVHEMACCVAYTMDAPETTHHKIVLALVTEIVYSL